MKSEIMLESENFSDNSKRAVEVFSYFNICILDVSKGKGGNYFFNEAVISCFYALQAIGYVVSVRENYLDPDAINVVFGANQYDSVLHPSFSGKKVIIFNLEQLGRGQSANVVNNKYFEILRNFPVFDYCKDNINRYKKLVGDGAYSPVYTPIGFVSQMEEVKLLPEMDKDIDVLFYGWVSASERRKKFYNY